MFATPLIERKRDGRALSGAEWQELMEDYTTFYEVKKDLEAMWPDDKTIAKAIEGMGDEERELSLRERIRNKIVALGAEGVKGHGWEFLYRPGATRKQFYRDLRTALGPFDPEVVATVLQDELKSALQVEGIMQRLAAEARVTGEDPRLFKEIVQPYFRAFPQKGG